MKRMYLFSLCFFLACFLCVKSYAQNIFPATGSVGIGTATPLAKVEIDGGNLLVKNLLNANDSSAVMVAQAIQNAGHATFGTSIRSITENAGANIYGMQFFTQASYLTGQTEKLRILGNGNVGIGITTPATKLAVNGTITTKEVVVQTSGWPD